MNLDLLKKEIKKF